jgi:predicted ester cyclase
MTTTAHPAATAAVPSVAPTTARLVLQRMLDEGFAAGNDSVVDELCSPDLIEHQFGLAASGPAAIANVKAAMRDVHGAMPDVSFTIEDTVEAGDTIWARSRGRGTATGPFFGPPSNRPIEFTVFDVVRIVDGRIVEHWGVPDRFAVLAQTGVLDRIGAPVAPVAPVAPARERG